MLKRGLSNNPVLYIILASFLVLILFFGYKIITGATQTTTKAQLTSFVLSLNKAVKEQSYHSYGSSDEIILNLPNDVTKLCIVDKTKEYDKFANIELASLVNIYEDKNIFFFPEEKYMPGELKNFELDKDITCIKPLQGKIKLKLTSMGNASKISVSEQEVQEKDCVSLLFSGDPNNKVDIVFLGQEYNDPLKFAPAVDDYIQNIFLATEPFESYSEKFNFYRIDDFNDLNCKTQGYIYCSEFNVKQIASNCPNDYIFVLLKRTKAADLLSPLRSSAYSNIMNINTADDNLVLMHEFGHVFANLADEYVDDKYYIGFNEEDYENCDDDRCAEWNSLQGTGCFRGCSLNSFYRATQKSIMNNYLHSNEYGILNNNIILKRLGVYG